MDGLPTGEMYCWVWGKAPKYDRWNTPTNLFSWTRSRGGCFHRIDTTAQRASGLLGIWSGTLAVDFDANEAMPERAEETFKTSPATQFALAGQCNGDLRSPQPAQGVSQGAGIWWSALSGYSASLCDLNGGGKHKTQRR